MDRPQVYTNERDSSSLEKGDNGGDITKYEKGEKFHGADYVVTADDKFQFDTRDLDRVQRRLQQRHVQMYAPFSSAVQSLLIYTQRIAIAGTIGEYLLCLKGVCITILTQLCLGTGLFLGSGAALNTGGPLGALIAYALVGTVAFAVCAHP